MCYHLRVLELRPWYGSSVGCVYVCLCVKMWCVFVCENVVYICVYVCRYLPMYMCGHGCVYVYSCNYMYLCACIFLCVVCL